MCAKRITTAAAPLLTTRFSASPTACGHYVVAWPHSSAVNALAACFRRIMQHRGYCRGEIRSFTASQAGCNRRRAPSSCVPRFSFPCERASLTFKAILLFLRPESPRFATHVLGRGIDARLRSGGGVFRHHHVGLQGGAEYFRGGHGRQNLELRRRRGGGAAYFGDI